jgi:hypothetical protein
MEPKTAIETTGLLFWAVLVLGLGTLVGFFRTRTPGYGKFNASVLIVIFIMTIAGVLYAGGRLEGAVMGHLLFAALGYAGWMVAGKESTTGA